MTFAGVSSSQITRICVTHFHGDHCLGLPGILQRLSLDRVGHPVDVYFPAEGLEYFERLRHASIYDERAEIRPHPVEGEGIVADEPPFTLVARRLDHRTETLGWRVEEPDGRRMLPEKLRAAGITGADIGTLQHEGSLATDGRTVTLEEMSEHRPGQRFAFVMDTRLCTAAIDLAEAADLFVCESTFLDADAALADAYAHLTAAQAAEIASAAGARRLVLTHFSQRYPDDAVFAAEAGPLFPDVVVAHDSCACPCPRADGGGATRPGGRPGGGAGRGVARSRRDRPRCRRAGCC
jgi:ribonuclease Z